MSQTLIISAAFPPEPIVSAKLADDMASILSKNYKVIVVSPRPSRPLGFTFENNLNKQNFVHHQLNSFTCPKSSFIGRIRESYSFGIHCAKYIKKNYRNIDLIYANTWPLLAQFLTVRVSLKHKIPIIIHVQDIYPESLTNKIPRIGNLLNIFLLPIDKYILQKATKVIAISVKMKEYLVKTRKIPASKVAVVINWQDEASFTNHDLTNKNSSNLNRAFTFMYLGNIGPVAGLEMVLEAFMNAELKNARFIIAGSGSVKKQLEIIAEKNLADAIEFLSVPDGKVPEIQAQSDVMLLPLKKGAASTSIPSKLPAYMFSARPIIAAVDADSDTAEAITKSGCGWVVEPENISTLSVKMQEVAGMDKAELEEMGLKGRDYALKHFSKHANLPKLVAIIEEAAKA